MVKKKGTSKRATLKHKYKVEKRKKEHDRKLKKAARRSAGLPKLTKKKRDPGIPNSWPHKAELLAEIAAARDKAEARKMAAKQQRKTGGASSSSLLLPSSHKAPGATVTTTTTAEMLLSDAQKRGAAFEEEEQEGSEAQTNTIETKKKLSEDAVSALASRTSRAFGKEVNKVLDACDVVIEVLDARDPSGSRSEALESDIVARSRKLVLVLNKVDLVPRDVVVGWLDRLRADGHAALATRANVTSARDPRAGVDAVLQLLKSYAKRENAGGHLVVGVVGFPNAGKSSLVKALVGARRATDVGVSATPGATTTVREVKLDKRLTLVDSPGVIAVEDPAWAASHASSAAAASSAASAAATGRAPLSGDRDDGNDALALFRLASLAARGCLDPADLPDASDAARVLLDRGSHRDALAARYGLDNSGASSGYDDTRDARAFLARLATKRGKLRRGGAPDVDAVARDVLHDFRLGKLAFYVEPPPDDDAAAPRKERDRQNAVLVDAFGPDFDPLKHDAAVLGDDDDDDDEQPRSNGNSLSRGGNTKDAPLTFDLNYRDSRTQDDDDDDDDEMDDDDDEEEEEGNGMEDDDDDDGAYDFKKHFTYT